MSTLQVHFRVVTEGRQTLMEVGGHRQRQVEADGDRQRWAEADGGGEMRLYHDTDVGDEDDRVNPFFMGGEAEFDGSGRYDLFDYKGAQPFII